MPADRRVPEAPAEERILGAKWAVILCVGMLLGFCGVIVSAIDDKRHLSTIETISEPTAVGDTRLFPSSDIQPDKQVALWNAHPLFLGKADLVHAEDASMLKMGMEDGGKYFVYKPAEKDPSSNGAALFLKVHSGEFVRVRQ